MKFHSKIKFLASEVKTSKKTQNPYTIVSCMVGAETLSVMSETPCQSRFGDDLNAEFELNTKYNQLKILSFEPCKA